MIINWEHQSINIYLLKAFFYYTEYILIIIINQIKKYIIIIFKYYLKGKSIYKLYKILLEWTSIYFIFYIIGCNKYDSNNINHRE